MARLAAGSTAGLAAVYLPVDRVSHYWLVCHRSFRCRSYRSRSTQKPLAGPLSVVSLPATSPDATLLVILAPVIPPPVLPLSVIPPSVIPSNCCAATTSAVISPTTTTAFAYDLCHRIVVISTTAVNHNDRLHGCIPGQTPQSRLWPPRLPLRSPHGRHVVSVTEICPWPPVGPVSPSLRRLACSNILHIHGMVAPTEAMTFSDIPWPRWKWWPLLPPSQRHTHVAVRAARGSRSFILHCM